MIGRCAFSAWKSCAPTLSGMAARVRVLPKPRMLQLNTRTPLRSAQILGVAFWFLSSACGDDESTPHRHEPEAADAAAEGGDASPDAGVGEVEAMLTNLFTTYNVAIEASCSCFVEMGAYSSVDECVMWQASRPDWVPCVASVVEAHPMSGGLEVFECIVSQLEENSKCLATKPCDPVARAECSLDALKCVGNESALSFALELGMACPDLTLLPRQE